MAHEMDNPQERLDEIVSTSGFLTWLSRSDAEYYAKAIQTFYGPGSPEDLAAAQGVKKMADTGLAAGSKQG